MNYKRRLILFGVGALLILIVLLVCVYKTPSSNLNDYKPNDNIINTDENLKPNEENKKVFSKVKMIGNIEISDIQIKLTGNNQCEVTAKVKNTSDEYEERKYLNIKAIDKDGEVIEIFGGIINPLAGYEEGIFEGSLYSNIMDVNDLEFIVAN